MSAGTVALVLLAWTGAYLDGSTPNNHRPLDFFMTVGQVSDYTSAVALYERSPVSQMDAGRPGL